MDSVQQKNELRQCFLEPDFALIKAVQGRLAEKIRGLGIYREALQIFISPSILLRQVRINALLDGKEVVMPGAGLREGFFLLSPYTISFRQLSLAVTYKGLAQFGKRLGEDDVARLRIGLLIDEARAIDRQGNRLGDGLGLFDLAVAALSEQQALQNRCAILGVLPDDERLIDTLPVDPWDVKCGYVVTPGGEHHFTEVNNSPGLLWDILDKRRIKRMNPLWQLYNKRRDQKSAR
ncbi:MAG: 5-formyltetrahydrofolate cyclo-ligase [Proteobacteria bacterium]|nr:5-formyltetrahydrofolate cyclo-ligase [Pseudomonadota bacterium]MBU1687957.1 5-formyltetrahydrofolate cyclo-ligase [Pseudomonadota bacterium]